MFVIYANAWWSNASSHIFFFFTGTGGAFGILFRKVGLNFSFLNVFILNYAFWDFINTSFHAKACVHTLFWYFLEFFNNSIICIHRLQQSWTFLNPQYFKPGLFCFVSPKLLCRLYITKKIYLENLKRIVPIKLPIYALEEPCNYSIQLNSILAHSFSSIYI